MKSGKFLGDTHYRFGIIKKVENDVRDASAKQSGENGHAAIGSNVAVSYARIGKTIYHERKSQPGALQKAKKKCNPMGGETRGLSESSSNEKKMDGTGCEETGSICGKNGFVEESRAGCLAQ